MSNLQSKSNKLSIDKLKMEIQSKISNVSFRFAEQISVGDEVIIPRNDELTPAKVTNVSVITMQGDKPFYIKNVFSNISRAVVNIFALSMEKNSPEVS